MACLRVAVDAASTKIPAETLGSLVAKFTGAYLSTRWMWPRKFAQLSQYCYLLTDARSSHLDVNELARLSDELQVKLFGEADGGQVTLFLFEGSLEAVTAFAGLDAAALARALRDPAMLPVGGQLSTIGPASAPRAPAERHVVANDTRSWIEQHAPTEGAAPPRAPLPMPQLEGLQGIYFTGRGLFIGDIVSSTPGAARHHLSLVEGAEHMPDEPAAFDADCVKAAVRYLASPSVEGMLYVPICFSNIIHASQRAKYEEMLSALPLASRSLLAAAVYDVPRDPAFWSLNQLRTTLGRYFTNIDLRTPDPGFEIEKLTQEAVTSVTLVLPEGDTRLRLATLRRFTDRLSLYKSKRIWPAVTNVRSRIELEACAAAKVPFVTGRGVCRLQTSPSGGRTYGLDQLPILAA